MKMNFHELGCAFRPQTLNMIFSKKLPIHKVNYLVAPVSLKTTIDQIQPMHSRQKNIFFDNLSPHILYASLVIWTLPMGLAAHLWSRPCCGAGGVFLWFA